MLATDPQALRRNVPQHELRARQWGALADAAAHEREVQRLLEWRRTSLATPDELNFWFGLDGTLEREQQAAGHCREFAAAAAAAL